MKYEQDYVLDIFRTHLKFGLIFFNRKGPLKISGIGLTNSFFVVILVKIKKLFIGYLPRSLTLWPKIKEVNFI